MRKKLLAAIIIACLLATIFTVRLIVSQECEYERIEDPWEVNGDLKLEWGLYPWTTVCFWDSSGFIITGDDVKLDLNGHIVMYKTSEAGPGPTGIDIIGQSRVTIRNGTIIDFQYGVWVEDSSEVKIEYMNITDSTKRGIGIHNSNEVNIEFNSITGSGEDGIGIDKNSFNVSVLGNDISESGDVGIGVYENSFNVTVFNNKVTNIDREGVHLFDVNHCTVSGNNISENRYYGILLYESHNNTIKDNIMLGNNPGAISLSTSLQNTIYHNHFPGRDAVEYVNSEYSWDVGYGTPDDKGYGGNYWDDNENRIDNFSGVNQDIPGSDGICDEAYTISGDVIDNYPLAEPWGTMLVEFDVECIVKGESKTCQVAVFSNCSIDDFNFDNKKREMNFTASDGNFCKVIMLNEALHGSFRVMINDVPTPCILDWDDTHHFIDFSLTSNGSTVKIKGEIDIIGDLNKDGKVTIKDIFIVAKNFGQAS